MNATISQYTIIDEAWLHTWFDTFNADYFDGSLPRPRLSLSQARTRLGSMSCKRRTTRRGTKTFDYAIHISTYYNQTERQYQNVLLHEMIHYHIAYHGIKDTAPHGKVFRQIMTTLNQKYGWKMSVSTQMGNAMPSANRQPAKRRLILVIEMAAQERFLAVVNPRYASHLQQQICRLPQVKHHHWYTSADAYFDAFPTVRSLRGKRITDTEWDTLTDRLEPYTDL